MATMRFTEAAVRKLPNPTSAPQAYYWDEEVRGLGLVVGRTGSRTFVVYARLAGEKGKRVKYKLGTFGQPRDDKHVWSVDLARGEAKKVIGKLATGTNPNVSVEASPTPAGPTLRDGVDTHLAKDAKAWTRGAIDPVVHTRDDQVPRRLARRSVFGIDRREADRAPPEDQGQRGQARGNQPGER
jgi:hypothetical protein